VKVQEMSLKIRVRLDRICRVRDSRIGAPSNKISFEPTGDISIVEWISLSDTDGGDFEESICRTCEGSTNDAVQGNTRGILFDSY
jgi:hypothetical protein